MKNRETRKGKGKTTSTPVSRARPDLVLLAGLALLGVAGIATLLTCQEWGSA